MKRSIHAGIAAAALAIAGAAHAQGQLNIVCSVPIPWCEALIGQFQKDTSIRVGMTQKGSGEAMAQVAAEKANPKYDLWYAGTGDPHLQAAEEGLTEAYKSPRMGELQDWAVKVWNVSKGRTVGVYAGALGYTYNTELLKKKNIPEPKCWADLIKPQFKDEVQVANPNSSGTSYNMRSVPITWVTDYSGDMGNTFASNGLTAGSRRDVSSSKKPKS